MFLQKYRLTTKDVRYIQYQKNIVWGKYFWFAWIKQYPNRTYNQCSVYIAADRVRKAVRRHQLKRKIMAKLIDFPFQDWPHYKVFVFLNKKNVDPNVINWDKQDRDKQMLALVEGFERDRHYAKSKLGKTNKPNRKKSFYKK